MKGFIASKIGTSFNGKNLLPLGAIFFPERVAPIIEVGSKFSSFRSDTRKKVSRFSWVCVKYIRSGYVTAYCAVVPFKKAQTHHIWE